MTKCDFEAGHKPIDKIGLLAKEVLEGKYGDGEERRRNLGCLYNLVQTRVNYMVHERDSKFTGIKIYDNVNKSEIKKDFERAWRWAKPVEVE